MGSVYGAEFEANRRSTSNDVQDIDGFVASLVQDSSYFFPATQYHRINLPRFSGHHVSALGVTFNLSDQPATCPPISLTNAFHSWQFGTANFTVLPTMCNTTLDALATSLS